MIAVFADVACPFTHVGLRRLVARRDHLGSSAVLRVRAAAARAGVPLPAVIVFAAVGATVGDSVGLWVPKTHPDR